MHAHLRASTVQSINAWVIIAYNIRQMQLFNARCVETAELYCGVIELKVLSGGYNYIKRILYS